MYNYLNKTRNNKKWSDSYYWYWDIDNIYELTHLSKNYTLIINYTYKNDKIVK